ncbi:MAG: T9SS type A sorting domain-containing protein [Lewinellaceae bacterium]|nr:T9SS type A sorting domain-containing protein [Lewinellaceae bacterium]
MEKPFSDTIYQIAFFGQLPDTLFNGELGYTGTDTTWQYGLICWGALEFLPSFPPLPESIRLRFTFASDSLAVPADGWMLDNMEAWPEIIHTVKDLEGMMETAATVVVYPNPASRFVNIVSITKGEGELSIRLVGLNGQIYGERLHGKVAKGIYADSFDLQGTQQIPNVLIVQVQMNNKTISKKIVRF